MSAALNVDPIAEFRAAIANAGIPVPEQVTADGKFHRFATRDKRRDDSGWYFLHLDGIPAGAFGCLRSGISEKWRADIGREFTAAEKREYARRMESARREREAAERERHAAAAEHATGIWDAAPPAVEHAYLSRKGIEPHGIRVKGARLVIPMRDVSGNLCSLQFIAGDGGKKFLPGGKVTGCYHSIGKPDGVLCIAEGYATAASIHEATGYAVACAFNAGNLKPVAEALRQKFPNLTLILCADNDAATEGNPGMTKAQEAAQAVNAAVAVPDFGDDAGTDFNDLADSLD